MRDYAGYIDYSPINDRPAIRWPGDARVALIVVPNVEHYEFRPPRNPYKNAFGSVKEPPEIIGYSTRDYGNRVGFWRMLEVFDQYNIRATCSLNAGVLELYPSVAKAMLDRGWSFMCHGLYNTRFLFGLGEDEERAFYREMLAMVERQTGQRMKGMLGPSFTASPATPRLMAEAGMIYSMDWFIDDQPFPISVPTGRLVGVPYSREINDSFVFSAHPYYGFDGDYLAQICIDQFDTLWEEGAESGRVMTIALHPYYIGLPHQIQYLERMFEHIFSHEGVWAATADEVAEYYLEHYYDEAMAGDGAPRDVGSSDAVNPTPQPPA